METLGCQQNAGFDQRFVVLSHRSQQRPIRHDTGLTVAIGFHQNHESHDDYA
jgi:hypothetical protein